MCLDLYAFGIILTVDTRSGFKWADVGFPFACGAVQEPFYTFISSHLLTTTLCFWNSTDS